MKFIKWFSSVSLVIAMIIIMWAIFRTINYSLSYKDMVQNTIREMVKSEALK